MDDTSDQPLDSRDFASYEEFCRAREQREMDKQLDELRDFTCGRPWCRGKMFCLWENIDCLQDMFAREFFGNELPEEEKLMDAALFTQCRLKGNGCDALPPVWHEGGSPENEALSWLSDMSLTLFYHKNNLVIPVRKLRKICHVDVDAVGRAVYRIAERAVKRKNWRHKEAEEALDLIEGFLVDPRLFDRIPAAVLIERSRGLMALPMKQNRQTF